jgi:Asp-tRNA(Asn)/Glu-tRNA(Gln) amidotransferase A subunit family amidase
MRIGRCSVGRHAAGAGVTTLDGDIAPAELDALLAAFRGYEAALMANDLDALDRFFETGPATMRGDASGLLVGHERISAFRGLRGGVAPRTITEIHVRVIDERSVLIVSVSAFAKGGSGLQTQLWRSGPDGWVIAVAHVTGAPPAVNGSVWRVVGSPLVPPYAGAQPGPSARALGGMTVAVKDLYDVAGFTVGAGVPEFLAEASAASSDADAVAVLRSAGAAVQGIAQTDEFAYSIAGRNVHYGTPPNPAVAGAIPGGSSSGPATAVSLGQATIGLATDTAGSIRVPASYQGLWGIRTTHGSVSTRGLLPLAPSFDTVGWLTRSAATLRAVAKVTLAPWGDAGPAGRDSGRAAATDADADAHADAEADGAAGGDTEAHAGDSGAPRFVVSRDLVSSSAIDVQDAFAELVADPAFGEVEEVDLGDLDAVFAAFRTVQAAEAWRVHGEWVAGHPGILGPDIAERFDIASRVTTYDEASARGALAEFRARFDTVLGARILLLPSASSSAPRLDASPDAIGEARAATLRMTAVAGVGGYPAVSAPLLRVPAAGGSAPVGLCFVGARHSDLALIDVAASIAGSLSE